MQRNIDDPDGTDGLDDPAGLARSPAHVPAAAPLLLDLPMELYLQRLTAYSRSDLWRLMQRRGVGSRGGVPGSGAPGGVGSGINPVGGGGGGGGDAASARVWSDGAPEPVRLGQRVHDAILLDATAARWEALAATTRTEAAVAAPDEPDAVRALLAREAFLRSDWAPVLTRGLAEITVVWCEAASGVWIKARPDLLDPATRTIWELKTVPRHDRAAVVQFLAQSRNVLQSATYRAALRAATGRDWRFGWLAVELAAPRRIERHDLPPHLLRQGDWMLSDALARVRGDRPSGPSGQALAPFDPAAWQPYALDARRASLLLAA